MGVSEAPSVPVEQFVKVMAKIRDLRAWAYMNKIDPWALRQSLLMALEMDTAAAVGRGVKTEDLNHFDSEVKKDVGEWIRTRGQQVTAEELDKLHREAVKKWLRGQI